MKKIDEIKSSIDIISVISQRVELKREGHIYKGLCPFHNENTPSFAVNPKTQRFNCFGCSKHGDVIDFVALAENCSPAEAMEKLSGSGIEYQRTEQLPAQEEWEALPMPKLTTGKHPRLGEPSMSWVYRSQDGQPLFQVFRYEADGRKEFRPRSYQVNTETGETKYRWAMPPAPRPLYGLEKLAGSPKATVLLVEGEKTADAAQKLFPNAIVMTWHGGRAAVRLYDFSPIHGRKVILWPDNDYTHEDSDGNLLPWEQQPGNDAMLTAAEILKPHCKIIRWVNSPEGTPCGWDVADADWTDRKSVV
jgi:hypothetical protein